MPEENATSMSEAVSRIEPGSSIAASLALEHTIPFAAGHEIIRQGVDDLTLIGPISDVLFDQLIGGGVVSRIRAAWVGNVSTGTGYRFREAIESDGIKIENHSNFSVALALQAGSMGIPYLPTHSLLGSDIFAENDRFIEREDPFTNDQVALIPAITPDWAIVHVQRADRYGNAHLWGNTGVTDPAVGAAEHVLVTAEELVDSSVIKSDPSRVAVTADQVTAVVECPFGAHPSPVAGYYDRDNEYYLEYHRQTDTQEAYDEWAQRWVHGVADRHEYADLVDRDLHVTAGKPAAEVRYGQ